MGKTYFIECVKTEKNTFNKLDVRFSIKENENAEPVGHQIIIDTPKDNTKHGLEEALDDILKHSGMLAQHGDWLDLR